MWRGVFSDVHLDTHLSSCIVTGQSILDYGQKIIVLCTSKFSDKKYLLIKFLTHV